MRIIAHLDMDAFFAAIEERDNPRLRGLPIVVGADPEGGKGRGVVSTANYAARKYGIRSALPITKAWQFSEAARKKGLPGAVFLEVNGHKYGEVSREVMTIVHERVEATGHMPAMVEQASVDEAYLDLSFTGSYEKAEALAREIKKEIYERERLTASVGIGPNKLIAKIASDRQKPDGLTIIRGDIPGEAEKFLEPLSIRVIPGVGPKSEEQFNRMRIKTIGDAKRLSREQLIEMMGKWGADLYRKLRGEDESPLVTDWEVKSVSEQETFPRDTHDAKFLRERLNALAEGTLARFLREIAHGGSFRSFRSVGITVRFADFRTLTRVVTLDEPVVAVDAHGAPNPKALETIQFQALRLFMPFLDRRENPDKKAFRLLGVRLERLDGEDRGGKKKGKGKGVARQEELGLG